MGLPTIWGYICFCGIPLVLWAFGSYAAQRRPLSARVFIFIAGSDNRLSLSRMQAFAWTLVIFGSFAAAMVVHTHISSGAAPEIRRHATAARQALETAETELKTAQDRLTKQRQASDDAKAAQTAAEVAASNSRAVAAASPSDPQVQKKAADDQAGLDRLRAQRAAAESLYQLALTDRDDKQKRRDQAEDAVNSGSADWVQIPPEVLALAGIAVGSGVFSSLISAVTSEGAIACVTRLSRIGLADLKTRWPESNVPEGSRPLLIEGTQFGDRGRVRMGRTPASILFWGSDGKAIVVDDSMVNTPSDIVVETRHGKLAYDAGGTVENPALGLPRFVYDVADLFRDDKSPNTFSLMKFQMFGWTVIAIAIYSWLFLSNLGPHISALPKVDSSVVILTGLSQSGYLVGKAVSNVGKDNQ